MSTHVLAVILARAGSKGLANKNVLPLAGRPMIAYTIDAAMQADGIDATCVTTDHPQAAKIARSMGVMVVDRPEELATDTTTVDAAARHAVTFYQNQHHSVSHVAILYGNVPLRSPGIIDSAINHLIETGADSVRSLNKVEKQHPDWLCRLENDRMVPFRKKVIYRRQDLEPLYYHDGGVAVVTRESLFTVDPTNAHAFLGKDRRGILSIGGPTVDVDNLEDFHLAEALLQFDSAMIHNTSDPTPLI